VPGEVVGRGAWMQYNFCLRVWSCVAGREEKDKELRGSRMGACKVQWMGCMPSVRLVLVIETLCGRWRENRAAVAGFRSGSVELLAGP